MTHRERAQAFYVDEPWKLEHWELLFSVHGVVKNTPDLYCLAKPVNSAAPEALILDPEFVFRQVDCWFLWYISGSMPVALSLMPFPLPLACFERANKEGLQFSDIARLTRFLSSA
jgi:hypothetical protein